MKRFIHLLLPAFLLPALFSPQSASATRYPQEIICAKDIVYNREHHMTLNVFAPVNSTEPKEVLVFVHGGSWIHGKKSTYDFFGKGMARKGVVAVIIDYRLCPDARYDGIAMDAAMAVKWVRDSIYRYGGDPKQIYVSGHSAGGQVAALISTDNSYFDSLGMKNPIRGCILIDGFGLDMNYYLSHTNFMRQTYTTVFTKDEHNWILGSPYYHMHKGMPEFLLFVGGRTYPSIKIINREFYTGLKQYQPDAQLIGVPHAHHCGMIFSFMNPHKEAYAQIINFMEKKEMVCSTE